MAGIPEQRNGETSSALTNLAHRATNPHRPGSYELVRFGPGAPNRFKKGGSFMFLILAVVLVLLWLGGFFVLHVSSFLIHLLLIFALISIIMNFVGGRRTV
jgi:hypothetical protein